MPFGIIGRSGPVVIQEVGFGFGFKIKVEVYEKLAKNLTIVL